MNRRNWWDFLEIWELEYAKLCQRKIRALDDERLVVSVLELPPDIGEADFNDVLLQKVGVLIAKLQVLSHVFDAVFYGI